MSEELYRYTKTKFDCLPRVLAILIIVLLGTGNLTFGISTHNFAPYLAAFLFILQFRWLIWEWRPQRWSLTLGPKALIFEERGEQTSILKNDITRILSTQLTHGHNEYLILLNDNSHHVIPRICIGNDQEFAQTLTTLRYPLERVQA